MQTTKYRSIAMRDIRIATIALLAFTLCDCKRRQSDSVETKQERPNLRRAREKPSEATMPSFEMMRVALLGTGTPTPDPARSKPAVAIIAEGRPYVVDFGAGLVGRAVEAQALGITALDPLKLSRAFATHLHSDHTSGLSDLWLTPAAIGRQDPLIVYGPPGIANMVHHLFSAYEEDLGIRTAGRPLNNLPPGYRMEAREIDRGVVYEDSRIKVTAFPVTHGEWQHAVGYRFDSKNRTIVISGDTAPTDTVVEACNGCDVLVHEVYCKAGFDMGSPHFKHYHGTSHTSTIELAQIASRAKPKRLVLYHLLFFGCTEAQLLKEITDRYDGEVTLGRDLDVY